ncbi:24259_t:CDS:2 [Cetraspora pellucida]|uniref:24259_t:CDS:1 n=1 Tax=Cetraspora pellucida TaxID=1433469 RepID=A0A9N9D8G2_9GLOM|nr:24259_t:CDS:2 [Cetraspora pellucida]
MSKHLDTKWNFKTRSGNDKENFFLIYVGQTIYIYLNDYKFIIYIVVGNSEHQLKSGWCCISDSESITEIFLTKAISSLDQKLFNTTIQYSGSMVIELNNQNIINQLYTDINFYPHQKLAVFVSKILEDKCVIKLYQDVSKIKTFYNSTLSNVWKNSGFIEKFDEIELFGLTNNYA